MQPDFKLKPTVRPERNILRECLDILSAHEKVAYVSRLNSGGVFYDERGNRIFFKLSPQGSPDLVAMLKGGRTLFIETKSAAGKVSKIQQDMHDKLRKGGGIVMVIRDPQDMLQRLNNLGVGNDGTSY